MVSGTARDSVGWPTPIPDNFRQTTGAGRYASSEAGLESVTVTCRRVRVVCAPFPRTSRVFWSEVGDNINPFGCIQQLRVTRFAV